MHGMVVNGKREQRRCSRYRLDVVRNLSAQGFIPGRDVKLTDLEQEGCVDGWSYSKDIYQSTLASEFDLVCSDEWKQPFTATVYFIGVLFGSFFSGQLSDRFGRKPVLFATMAVQTLFSFIQVFSTSWTMFTILLFFNGLGQMSNFVAALVLGAEILTGNVRVLYSSLDTCLGFVIEKANVLDLLRKSSIRTTTLIFCFVFFCSTTGYFGLSLNTAQLHANPYISCFISAAVEVPAYISSWLILHYLPRRPSVMSSLLLGAMPLYLILMVPQRENGFMVQTWVKSSATVVYLINAKQQLTHNFFIL
ncbi:hypothetical protein JOQ06_018761 [Pogonophryne albipinna]|uniref:Major facilitator superfamily (MFS) profile domain-containing protein n=1 Tax=Pogonophryne albipinna TaxID=1090488 RepID=A0AAD6AT79_9TELE|nr:hypothetical protein JOQ06_018761 [Pogonophryne albipinna]